MNDNERNKDLEVKILSNNSIENSERIQQKSQNLIKQMREKLHEINYKASKELENIDEELSKNNNSHNFLYNESCNTIESEYKILDNMINRLKKWSV